MSLCFLHGKAKPLPNVTIKQVVKEAKPAIVNPIAKEVKKRKPRIPTVVLT